MLTLAESNFSGLTPFRTGKVRDLYDLGDSLLIVATDRLSAFDVVLPNPIPYKGAVLTALSRFWFGRLGEVAPNHLKSTDVFEFPEVVAPYTEQLKGRSMLVEKTEVLPVECIVRGYLTGSGLKEYNKTGTVCGIGLEPGLVDGSQLPEPIFTPSTKADEGHDENISFEQSIDIIGKERAEKVRDMSLALYTAARDYARERGIIIADTKFEFGVRDNGEIIVIDEVLTPDSSRFWPASEYAPGKAQPSFDKQYVRDYLATLDWDKTPPAPELPEEVIANTTKKYLEAYTLLTDQDLTEEIG